MPPAEFYERMRNGELPQSQTNNPAVIDSMNASLGESVMALPAAERSPFTHW